MAASNSTPKLLNLCCCPNRTAPAAQPYTCGSDGQVVDAKSLGSVGCSAISNWIGCKTAGWSVNYSYYKSTIRGTYTVTANGGSGNNGVWVSKYLYGDWKGTGALCSPHNSVIGLSFSDWTDGNGNPKGQFDQTVSFTSRGGGSSTVTNKIGGNFSLSAFYNTDPKSKDVCTKAESVYWRVPSIDIGVSAGSCISCLGGRRRIIGTWQLGQNGTWALTARGQCYMANYEGGEPGIEEIDLQFYFWPGTVSAACDIF